MTIQFGFIDQGDGANLRTLPAEMKGSTCLTLAPLPPGTRVSVIRDHAQAPGWSYVSTVVGGYLLQGYVQAFRITTQLPEPAATLYQVRPGDRLEPIAARIYRQAIQPGRDLRFYENVIHHVNVKSGRKGVQRIDGDVRLVAGERIWLVSIAFANQLQGIMAAAGPGGGYAGVPVFQPGSITAAPAIPIPFNPWGSGTPLLSQAVKEGGTSRPEPEPTLTERTLSDAELEKLLEKLPNWDKLKDFVGRRIPQEGTPEFNALKRELQAAGYRLEKLSSDAQPYRLRRPNGKALGDEYGALTVTQDGLVVLKVGKGTLRLSVFTRYRKNYLEWVEKTQGPAARAAAEVRLSAGHPMHHLIPDGVAQSHPLTRMAMERIKGYTIDRGSNILDMHSGLNMEGQLIHSGSHPFYSKFVNARLDRALSMLRTKGSTSSWTPQVIEEAIIKVENELRQAIESGSLKEPAIKVIQEQRGGKVLTGRKLALLELRSHGESHIT